MVLKVDELQDGDVVYVRTSMTSLAFRDQYKIESGTAFTFKGVTPEGKAKFVHGDLMVEVATSECNGIFHQKTAVATAGK